MKMKLKNSFHFGNQNKEVSPFFKSILPDYIKENDDHIITGEKYHSIYALKEYPLSTSSFALLSEIGRMKDVNIHMKIKKAQKKELESILKNSIRNSNMMKSSSSITNRYEGKEIEENINNMLSYLFANKHNLIYTSVFIDMMGSNLDELNSLKEKVEFILNTKNIIFSKLLFRQKEGLLSSLYFGKNMFSQEFDRLIPDESVINLYPFSVHGKYDKCGFYIGSDEFSGEIIDDIFDISDDKTNGNILVLGNSGQGKSYLNKIMICNILESGKNVIILDPENEYTNITNHFHGENVDFSSGLSFNPLQIFFLTENGKYDYEKHISYILDFFILMFSFSNITLSALEDNIHSLYKKFNIGVDTLYSKSTIFPTLKDLYYHIKDTLEKDNILYPKEILKELCISLYPIACGNNSKYFSSSSNELSSRIINFNLKEALSLSDKIKQCVLFNVLSFTENALLNNGNTVLIIDELYLFLENKMALLSIRDNLKRVRKRNSSLILATQNINDLLLDNIKEYTKPLLSIPQRKFLFSPGSCDNEKYMDMLDISPIEFAHIKDAKRGKCVYKCGLDTYIMNVHAPEYKSKLF